MVNVLVIEDNFQYSKNLINILSDKILRIKLCKIATDGKEAIDIIKNAQNNIDVIAIM